MTTARRLSRHSALGASDPLSFCSSDGVPPSASPALEGRPNLGSGSTCPQITAFPPPPGDTIALRQFSTLPPEAVQSVRVSCLGPAEDGGPQAHSNPKHRKASSGGAMGVMEQAWVRDETSSEQEQEGAGMAGSRRSFGRGEPGGRRSVRINSSGRLLGSGAYSLSDSELQGPSLHDVVGMALDTVGGVEQGRRSGAGVVGADGAPRAGVNWKDLLSAGTTPDGSTGASNAVSRVGSMRGGVSRRPSRKASRQLSRQKSAKEREEDVRRRWLRMLARRAAVAVLIVATHVLVAYMVLQAVVVVVVEGPEARPPFWRLSLSRWFSWFRHACDTVGEPVLWLLYRLIIDPILLFLAADLVLINLLGAALYYGPCRRLRPENRWRAPPLPPPASDGDVLATSPAGAEDGGSGAVDLVPLGREAVSLRMGAGLEMGSKFYPMVLVQLPMYNEKEVFETSLSAACALQWPRDRLLIQLLDDSTDHECSLLMEQAVIKWRACGHKVVYKHRLTNIGFKAGNLMEGLAEPYAKDYEFVAVLDADFVPDRDYLLKTVCYLKEHASLALVQARWTFLNQSRCGLTRYQAILLTWHFMAEQLVGSFLFDWFGFNGTAGVWRLSAIRDAGGWRHDTTVEDMDMAFCTVARGWKFLFLPDVTCLSELPAQYRAYRKQQHRWTCGPTQLIRKRLRSLLAAKIPLLKKLYIVIYYVLLHRVVQYVILCAALVLLVPLAFLAPRLTPWGLLINTTARLTCVVFSPGYFLLFLPFVLFDNTMTLLKVRAVFIGLFEMKKVHEWVVTLKVGDNGKNNPAGVTPTAPSTQVASVERAVRLQPSKFITRCYGYEGMLGLALLVAGIFGMAVYHRYFLGCFIIVQGLAFLKIGFGSMEM